MTSVSVRVAQVVGKMNGGGVETVVMNYYRHIARDKFQFDFLVDSDSQLVPLKEIESLGGRVLFVPPYQHVLDYQRTMISLLKEQGWPIVHSHINSLSVFPLRAAKKAGIPVRIAHSHSSKGGGKGEVAKNTLKNLLKSQSTRFPTDLVACSIIAGEWLFGAGTNFTVVRNAVDLDAFAPDEVNRIAGRRELHVSEKTFVVGHVGRMVPSKNHLFLLDVFQSLLDIEPDSLLVLAGAGPLLSDVKKKVAKSGLDDKVCFLGQRNDIVRFYQAFDVLCLPSLYEGLPMVGVESQASSTPILVSNEVTREAAMTSLMEFESLTSSSRAWAEHLIALRGKSLSPKDFKGLAEFDIRKSARRLEEVYERCMEGMTQG